MSDDEFIFRHLDRAVEEVAAVRVENQRLRGERDQLRVALETIATLDGTVPMPAAVMTAVAHDALAGSFSEPEREQ